MLVTTTTAGVPPLAADEDLKQVRCRIEEEPARKASTALCCVINRVG
jgi:hypothetical protein